jgi:hypothetical protein
LIVGAASWLDQIAGRCLDGDLDAVEPMPHELALQQRAQRLVEIGEHRVEWDVDDERPRRLT